jgi:hypothetical protein
MYFKPLRRLMNQHKARLVEKGMRRKMATAQFIVNQATDQWPIHARTNKLARNNMSSSIKKNWQSVALMSTERLHWHREKQRTNQTNHDDSNAETQPRPIPLLGAKRSHRLHASKCQNQLNDAKPQNWPVPSSNAERARWHREAKRKNRVDFVCIWNTRDSK